MKIKMDVAALHRFIDREFPQVSGEITVDSVAPMRLRARLVPGEKHQRPGGSLSGATIFGLADMGVYLAVLAMIGPKALAVTTSSSIDFMRKPTPERDLLCDVQLLKLGRRLAVGDALIYAEGQDQPVARATMTFSIPPRDE